MRNTAKGILRHCRWVADAYTSFHKKWGKSLRYTQKELLDAIENRCMTCRWWNPDAWKSCKVRSCPNYDLAKFDKAAASPRWLLQQIGNVCLACIKNQDGTCPDNCSYKNLDTGIKWIVHDRPQVRRIRA